MCPASHVGASRPCDPPAGPSYARPDSAIAAWVAAVCDRGCLLVNSASELASHDPEVRKRARETFGALEDLLVGLVEEARDAKDLPPDTDAREVGRLLLAVLQGMEFLAKTGMEREALGRIGEAAVARLLGAAPARRQRRRPP